MTQMARSRAGLFESLIWRFISLFDALILWIGRHE
jgi:hypothetical protein